MKKLIIMTIVTVTLLSSCNTYTGQGAAFGSIIGSAVGGLAGGPRGSDIGTLVGMATGAAVGAAADAKAEQERYMRMQRQQRYYDEGDGVYYDRRYESGTTATRQYDPKAARVRTYHENIKNKYTNSKKGYKLERNAKDPGEENGYTPEYNQEVPVNNGTPQYDDRIEIK
ncbi:MAG: glycine zipper family protein [Prevotella sp.]